MNDYRRCSGFDTALSRRDLLSRFGSGLGGITLSLLLAEEASASERKPAPHFRPRARRVIQIFLQGGLSQVDSFDYKPELIKYHSKTMPEGKRPDAFFGQV